MIIALFDSDGTLYSAQFGRGLMQYALQHHRRGKASLYFASLVPDALLARFIPSAKERFQRARIARLAWLVQGYDLEQTQAAFAWVVDEYLLPTARQEVLERLRFHQDQGHRVIIVSGMFTTALERIGLRLGVTDWVGTQIEYHGGRCTGRILPPVIKGVDKVEQVRRYVLDHGLQVDWSSSFAHGDSFSDRDMLELVGHPVAVHPDPALRLLAHQRGWGILEA
jgi:HAD superfamily hydrolase (TIGR01490 family)